MPGIHLVNTTFHVHLDVALRFAGHNLTDESEAAQL
jgi:hypothetical protein